MMETIGKENKLKKMENCFKSNSKFITSNKTNGFVTSIYLAQNNHLPLALKPDHIFLAILQGLSKHISLNSEKLRNHFVDFDGETKIIV